MVIRISLLWILFSVMTLHELAHARSNFLTLSVDTAEVELGKAVVVTLRASSLLSGIDSIDLTVLGKDFVVVTPWDVSLNQQQSIQSWRFRLYPRRNGKLLIPPLHFKGMETMPQSIIVTPAREQNGNSFIRVTTEVSNTGVWVNQEISVSMKIDSESPYIRFDTDSHEQPDIEITQLPVKSYTYPVDGTEHTEYHLRWKLYAKNPGTRTLQLPMVKYLRDGVTTHRFSLPEIDLDVRPLPLFIPPTMPVGRVNIRADMPESFFQLQNQLQFLTLHIQSEGNSKQIYSQVLRQFQSGEESAFYPPKLTDNKENGMSGKSYQIPFEPKRWGLLTMPVLQVQYFDPKDGKIHSGSYALGRYLVVNKLILYIFTASVFFLLLLLFVKSLRWLRYQLHIIKLYRSAEQKFLQAKNREEIKAGLALISRAEGWPENSTAADWLRRWKYRYGEVEPISEGISKLQKSCYAQLDVSLDEVRHLLASICYRRMPLLKYFR